MTPEQALQLLEQVAANSPMPLAGHLQCKQAVKVLFQELTLKQEASSDDKSANKA